MDLFSVEDAAKYLGVSLPTMYALVKSGQLPSFKVGKRVTRISRRHLEAWIDAQAEANTAALRRAAR